MLTRRSACRLPDVRVDFRVTLDLGIRDCRRGRSKSKPVVRLGIGVSGRSCPQSVSGSLLGLERA